MLRTAALLLGVLLLPLPAFAAQEDARGCADHPLFTRMPQYWIRSCEKKEFDAHEFVVGKNQKQTVEGSVWRAHYLAKQERAEKASQVQILRNFENAIKKVGGTTLYVDQGRETLKVEKDGKELWVEVLADHTGGHQIWVVEKEAMKQDVVANAEAFANDLKATGHVAIYGIYFDTGKWDLKPESDAAVAEIAKLLGNDPALKLYVVGHTDTVGNADSNLKLSQQRADAVMQALIKKHNIAAARLRTFGAGPFVPVASNATDDGRAKNRRVELVQQ